MRQVSMATRDEVTAVLVQRYAEASRHDRGRILDEMVAITGHHRKYAARLLRGKAAVTRSGPRPGRRIYNIGNPQPVHRLRLKEILEDCLGAKGREALPADAARRRTGHLCRH